MIMPESKLLLGLNLNVGLVWVNSVEGEKHAASETHHSMTDIISD